MSSPLLREFLGECVHFGEDGRQVNNGGVVLENGGEAIPEDITGLAPGGKLGPVLRQAEVCLGRVPLRGRGSEVRELT